jgi:hypothetical protein
VRKKVEEGVSSLDTAREGNGATMFTEKEGAAMFFFLSSPYRDEGRQGVGGIPLFEYYYVVLLVGSSSSSTSTTSSSSLVVVLVL